VCPGGVLGTEIGDGRDRDGDQRKHGRPALTAVLVITTGVMGAVIVSPLMNALKIRDYAARGFAVGLASHGIGTARAFAVDEIAGTFAGIAMGLNGVVTALVVPFLLRCF
jgi:putative effector of murein hydrolase